jgi:FixJ family two-component response regulator
MGGEEVLHQLMELNPEVPITLSSGFGEGEAAVKFSALPQASFLQKPYTAGRLVEAVSGAFRHTNRSGRAEN